MLGVEVRKAGAGEVLSVLRHGLRRGTFWRSSAVSGGCALLALYDNSMSCNA